MELDFSKTNPLDINREYILSKVSQEEIYLHFTGNPVVYDKHILSPLRKDKSPSFSYKLSPNGKILWRDWGTGEKGDCFTLIEKKYGYTFKESLLVIFNQLINNSDFKVNENVKRELQERANRKFVFKKPIIAIKSQPFTYADFQYWDQFKISLQNLETFNVESAKHVWINKWDHLTEAYLGYKLVKTYSNSNPTYSYNI